MFHFYTPWKRQKTKGCIEMISTIMQHIFARCSIFIYPENVFSRGVEMEHWAKFWCRIVGNIKINREIDTKWVDTWLIKWW